MTLCGGDVLQYKELKKGPIDTYCIKLKAYVDSIAGPREKQMQDMISGGKRK
jgi:hypothetical protein